MKTILTFILCLFIVLPLFATDNIGNWDGGKLSNSTVITKA